MSEERKGRLKDDRPSEAKVARTESPTIDDSDKQEPLPVTTEDLIPLIKAITFAYPHFSESPSAIHHEIISVASRQEPLLASITLEEVEAAYNVLIQRTRKEEEMKQKVIKMYTVGDATTAPGAADSAASHVKASEATTISVPSSESGSTKRWVPFQLDIPADTSGSKPHQALINFTENSSGSSGEHSSGDGGKPSSKTVSSSTSSPASSEGSVFVVKIQVAMGGAEAKSPMLLYNQDRSIKTFIHCTPVTAEGYNRIQAMILQQGAEGALGKAGGTKGYFYAKKYPTSKTAVHSDVAATAGKSSKDLEKETPIDSGTSRLICIDCKELAPEQQW